MLTTLDTLLEQGAGGRKLLLLRQVWDLFLRIGGTIDEAPNALFDEIMATIAAHLDEDCTLCIADDLGFSQAMLPAYTATVTSRAHEIRLRRQVAVGNPAGADHHSMPTVEKLPQDEQDAHKPDAHKPDVHERDAHELEIAIRPQPENVVAMPHPVETRVVAPAEFFFQETTVELPAAPSMTEAMTNALVARGDREAIIAALGDQTAPFARSSLTTLVELAVSDRALKEALVARRDLPEAMVERLMPFLKPEARASILMSGANFTAEDAEDALEQAQQELIEAYRGGQRLLGVDSCIALVEEEKATNDEIIVLLGRDLRIAELASFIARRLGIRLETAFNALGGRLDHTAVVLLKVLGAGSTATGTIMDMRRRLGCRTARETASAVATQGRYSETEARELLGRMDALRLPQGQAALPEAIAA
ncbi:MAG: DUF2336 domain-containing protein [Beijerinckiaceae bacterium]